MAVSAGHAAAARVIALGAYVALLVLVVLWEGWIAPPTPLARVFWIVLKTFPLALLLPWLWGGRARAYVFAALLLLLYFCDGIALTYHALRSDNRPMLGFGLIEIALAFIFIVSAPWYARFSFRASSPAHEGTEPSRAAD